MRSLCGAAVVLWFALLARPEEAGDASLSPEIGVAELRAHVFHLASDELEGRRAGTAGAEKAADYIAARFAAAGLAPGGDEGSFLAWLSLGGRAPAPDRCALAFRSGAGKSTALALGADWEPFSFSSEADLSGLEAVFAGYGLKAPDLGWDDYAGLDVSGKVVVLLRRGPDLPGLAGRGRMRLAFEQKAKDAKAAGAAAVLLLDDRVSNPDDAGHCPTRVPVRGGGPGIPFVYLKPAAADRLFAAAGLDLPRLIEESELARAPRSRRLPKVRVDLSVALVPRRSANVIGILEGRDEARRAEVVIIGAHYDHLGTDGMGAIDIALDDGIWNGADDNASGTAGLMELAEHFALAKPRPARTLVFVAFTGEELGLIGSSHYVKHPAIPLARTVAMVNLDMLGRSKDRRVMIGGTGTSPVFGAILDAAAVDSGLTIRRDPSGFAPSDSMPFARAKVPVLFFFAGIHPDYHRSTDHADRLDYETQKRFVDVAARAARSIADLPERPPWAEAPARGPRGPYLGVTLADEGDAPGAVLGSVMAGSPAAEAGLLDGDRVVRVGKDPVADGDDLVSAIAARKPGDEVEVEVRRGEETLVVTVKLGSR
jgi:Zn-dependent M28 family amino/carboxypeptidase